MKKKPPAHVVMYITSGGKNKERKWNAKKHGRPTQENMKKYVEQESDEFERIRYANLVNTRNGNLVAYFRA